MKKGPRPPAPAPSAPTAPDAAEQLARKAAEISALREIGRRPDLPGHRQAVSGIVCGAIGVLISIAGWVILAVIASRGGS